MDLNRRNFLTGTLAMGVTVAAAGCLNARNKLTGTSGAPMQGFADKPLKRVRVGIAGVGFRGIDAVDYISQLPNTEVAALCDLYQERIDLGNRLLVEKSRKPKAKRAWKTTPPAPLATFRPGVIDLNPDSYRKNKEAMSI